MPSFTSKILHVVREYKARRELLPCREDYAKLKCFDTLVRASLNPIIVSADRPTDILRKRSDLAPVTVRLVVLRDIHSALISL